MSLTDKVIGVVAVVLAVLAINAVVILNVMSGAKAHEDAAIQKASVAAEINAQKISDNWKEQYDAAESTHKSELASGSTISFVPISVSKYPRQTVLPASDTTPGSASPAGSTEICDGLLQSSSAELSAEFGVAKDADKLVADYRELYDSWPQISKSKPVHVSAP